MTVYSYAIGMKLKTNRGMEGFLMLALFLTWSQVCFIYFFASGLPELERLFNFFEDISMLDIYSFTFPVIILFRFNE